MHVSCAVKEVHRKKVSTNEMIVNLVNMLQLLLLPLMAVVAIGRADDVQVRELKLIFLHCIYVRQP